MPAMQSYTNESTQIRAASAEEGTASEKIVKFRITEDVDVEYVEAEMLKVGVSVSKVAMEDSQHRVQGIVSEEHRRTTIISPYEKGRKKACSHY